MTTHTLIFTPSGLRMEAQDGETVYAAGLRSGVDIQSICGGKGLCKRCQIEVDTGRHAKFNIDVREDHVSKLSPTEKKAIHDGELSDSRRLSCRTKILGDLVVNIPADSRERETAIEKKSTEFQTALNPAIRLYMVKLAVPSLEDNPSDGEALIAALLSEHAVRAKISHETLIKLQEILRQHEREVIAVVRNGQDIIDVWPPSPFDLYGAAIDTLGRAVRVVKCYPMVPTVWHNVGPRIIV